jgi:hypothetical protein
LTFTLLYIRLKQLQREINGLGLYVLVFIAIAASLFVICYKQFKSGENAYYIVAISCIISIGLQFYRKDKPFIYKQLKNPHLQIFSEYAALLLPFAATSLFTKSWLCFPILFAFLFCIPLFKFSFRQKTVFKNLSAVIPAANFEWLSGVRKYYISFISLYLAALVFCWVRILPLFLLWLLTIIIASIHNECESIQVLREGNKLAKTFLINKLRINSICVIILYTPVIIINTFFNSEFLVISLLFIPMQISLVCFAIVLKYNSYKPNKKQPGNNIALAIVYLCTALPYFLPLPVILAIIYFYKAKNNLNQYLNDQHQKLDCKI